MTLLVVFDVALQIWRQSDTASVVNHITLWAGSHEEVNSLGGSANKDVTSRGQSEKHSFECVWVFHIEFNVLYDLCITSKFPQ